MKKVFSVKQFIEEMEPQVGEKSVLDSLKLWALNCEGLTPEEMKEKGLRCNELWLVEVEEERNKMKQVFSVLKFIEVMEPQIGAERVLHSLKLWGLDCEGLTPEEMKEKGLRCNKAWLIEVED